MAISIRFAAAVKYDDLQQQLDNTEEKQISTSESDSRALIINKNIVEISYNTQSAVDAKHYLFVHAQAIHRSEYQDAIERNNENIRQNPDYYKRRQSICEHPFGTIKRQWGYTYTLMKGLQKVNGEMNLIMLMYNIKRTLTILGFTKMMQALQNWK